MAYTSRCSRPVASSRHVTAVELRTSPAMTPSAMPLAVVEVQRDAINSKAQDATARRNIQRTRRVCRAVSSAWIAITFATLRRKSRCWKFPSEKAHDPDAKVAVPASMLSALHLMNAPYWPTRIS
jgi:hypothetical protein